MLRFQRDGRVAVLEHGEPDAWLDVADKNAILVHLRSGIELEDGITAGGLFRCLKPWGDVLSLIGWLDFSAWSTRAAVSHLREAVDRSDDPEAIDAVVLRPTVTSRTGRKRQAATLLVQWDAVVRFVRPLKMPGSSHADAYGALDLLPLPDWINLPVIVQRQAQFRVMGPGVAPAELSEVDVEPNVFDTLILGFLDECSAYGTPDDTIELRASLIATVEKLQADETQPD